MLQQQKKLDSAEHIWGINTIVTAQQSDQGNTIFPRGLAHFSAWKPYKQSFYQNFGGGCGRRLQDSFSFIKTPSFTSFSMNVYSRDDNLELVDVYYDFQELNSFFLESMQPTLGRLQLLCEDCLNDLNYVYLIYLFLMLQLIGHQLDELVQESGTRERGLFICIRVD